MCVFVWLLSCTIRRGEQRERFGIQSLHGSMFTTLYGSGLISCPSSFVGHDSIFLLRLAGRGRLNYECWEDSLSSLSWQTVGMS